MLSNQMAAGESGYAPIDWTSSEQTVPARRVVDDLQIRFEHGHRALEEMVHVVTMQQERLMRETQLIQGETQHAYAALDAILTRQVSTLDQLQATNAAADSKTNQMPRMLQHLTNKLAPDFASEDSALGVSYPQ